MAIPSLLGAIANISFYVVPLAIGADYAMKMGRYEEALEAINVDLSSSPAICDHIPLKALVLYFLGRSQERIDILNS